MCLHQGSGLVSEVKAGQQREKQLEVQIRSLSRQLVEERALGSRHVFLMSDLRKKHAVAIRGLQEKVDELCAGCHSTAVQKVSCEA